MASCKAIREFASFLAGNNNKTNDADAVALRSDALCIVIGYNLQFPGWLVLIQTRFFVLENEKQATTYSSPLFTVPYICIHNPLSLYISNTTIKTYKQDFYDQIIARIPFITK